MMKVIVHCTMHRGRGLKRRPKKQFKAQMAPDPEFVGSFFILITVFDNIHIVIIDIVEITSSNDKEILKSPKR